jgi:CheY-like chemotaxis protein
MVGIRTGGVKLALVVALTCAWSPAQTNLSLQEAGARNPSANFAPTRLGERVKVRGVVNSPAYHFPNHTLLAIEDGRYGAILKVDSRDPSLDPFHPGDDLEVDGSVAAFVGMAVIQPAMIAKLGVKPAPIPVEVALGDLIGFRYLGRLVRTQVKTQGVGDTANGAYLSIEAPERFVVFVPRAANQPTVLNGLTNGDLVNVTGVAYQYCSRPPFNRYFQLLVQDPAYLVPLPRGWFPPTVALAGAIAFSLLIGFFIWSRERRVRKQRERLRKTYQLGEEILAAMSAESILKRVRETLPEILNISGAQIYIHNRAAKALDSVAAEGEPPTSLPLSFPAGERSPAAVWCYQYHTALAIPDPDKTPFTIRQDNGRTPKSLLFLPMSAQTEVAGVLQLDRQDRSRVFTEDEHELAQHLANQAGVAIRLLEQRSVQEQLFRTEKLAAVGRLISGVVNELRSPLESIEGLAAHAARHAISAAAEHELSAIAGEARKASIIVSRLVSYASADQGDARPVAVGALLRKLIEFREGDWKASGIRVRDLTTREPLMVLGSQEQLEQVFLNLLVHAEQSLGEAAQKLITVRTSVLAKRLVVEIAFTGPPVAIKTGETAAVLGVTRSVIAGHGGEVRLIEKGNADPRFEVELPITFKERAGTPVLRAASAAARPLLEPSRRMTALVIENEEGPQRHLLAMLSAHGFRVVPVENADTGLDLAHRMRFDAAFCSVHAPGLNWVELSERMQAQVAAFVLVSDRFDAELAADFEGSGRFVLSKPVQESDLERVVRSLAPQVPAAQDRTA